MANRDFNLVRPDETVRPVNQPLDARGGPWDRRPRLSPTSCGVNRSLSGRRGVAASVFLVTIFVLSNLACSPIHTDSKPIPSGIKDNHRVGKMDTTKSVQTQETPAVNPKLRWDGGGVLLGETDSSVYSVQTFVETVSGLAKEQRFRSIQHLVHKYPDVALKSLQEYQPDPQHRQVFALIAETFQEQWGRSDLKDNAAGWPGYIALAESQPAVFAAKNQFRTHLELHEIAQGLKLSLPKHAANSSNPAMVVELHRLQSLALMLDDQMEPAIAQLQRAIDASDAWPYQTLQMQLLLGEFYRHGGQLEKWKSTWQQTVTDQSHLLVSHSLIDPSFWNRAAFLRPADVAWPDSVIENMRHYLVSAGYFTEEALRSVPEDEAIVWMTTGLQCLTRLEGQDALLALKKSEAATANGKIIDQLRLHQAQALVLAGQPGAASAILIRMISTQEGQDIADRAKAILGAMKLQNGAVRQGVNLIQTSLRSVERWPEEERLRVQADHALAQLMLGREAEALEQLNGVQGEFVQHGEIDQAFQCLLNKAKYFEKTNQSKLHQETLAELRDFENQVFKVVSVGSY